MTYRLLVKINGTWQEIGFRHLSVEEARFSAREWIGHKRLILPA